MKNYNEPEKRFRSILTDTEDETKPDIYHSITDFHLPRRNHRNRDYALCQDACSTDAVLFLPFFLFLNNRHLPEALSGPVFATRK